MNFPAIAAGTCIESPNREADPGSHWYYRSDPSGQPCWHLKKLDMDAPSGKSPEPVLPGKRGKSPNMQQQSHRPLVRSENSSASLPYDPARREALFRQFLQWRERQPSTP
jgi:hypothetical protein